MQIVDWAAGGMKTAAASNYVVLPTSLGAEERVNRKEQNEPARTKLMDGPSGAKSER